jgi:exosortase/archaeosortase family protein
MTLIALAVVFAYFTHPKSGDGVGGGAGGSFGSRALRALKSYGFWRSLILVLSAVPIAILTNALRVSGTGVLAHYYGTQVADGFFHSFSGWVVYIAAFLLLFAVGWLLDRVGGLGRGGRGSRGGRAAQASKDEVTGAADSARETGSKSPSPVGVASVKGVE